MKFNAKKLQKGISLAVIFAMLLSIVNIAPLLELSFAFASEDSVTDDVYGEEVVGAPDVAPRFGVLSGGGKTLIGVTDGFQITKITLKNAADGEDIIGGNVFVPQDADITWEYEWELDIQKFKDSGMNIADCYVEFTVPEELDSAEDNGTEYLSGGVDAINWSADKSSGTTVLRFEFTQELQDYIDNYTIEPGTDDKITGVAGAWAKFDIQKIVEKHPANPVEIEFMINEGPETVIIKFEPNNPSDTLI